ncbi:nucleotidyltransferase family protein [Salinimonas marina]|uniref:Nucleotidyltransferase family protein n=1 Tax=Salinimonas marina TaxID=2785918 RepID=A0A7S9DWI1_9ALTE|nr:nucleotidyltransferase family protein [Salinimonas marina]QPG05132.1 nucleotidyltransferase family protein [Salinimonas marina]
MDEVGQQLAGLLAKDSGSRLAAPPDEHLQTAAVQHGVALLLQHQQAVPGTSKDNLWVTYYREQVLSSQVQYKAVLTLCSQLKQHGIRFIVLKGWALSATLYNRMYLRPKTDIDLLIHPQDKARSLALFQTNGFHNPRGWQPAYIIDQISMCKPLLGAIRLNVDVHFELTNDKGLQPLFEVESLIEKGDYISGLGAHIICRPMAFIHCVIHLLHHQASGDFIKLIWYYDMHLLINAMSTTETKQLYTEIEKMQISRLVAKVTATLVNLFPSQAADALLEAARQLPARSEFDYLLAEPSLNAATFRQLRYTRGWAAKLGVAKEGLFPPRAEIEKKYGQSDWPLVMLYIRRIITGIKKRL